MDEDKKWEFDAPQHYCDLPSAITDDDSEIADQYFFAKADDTVYFEPNDEETFQELRREEEPKEQFPVIRRRSLSVGSKPLQIVSVYETNFPSSSSTFRKPLPPKANANKGIDNPDQHFVGGLRAYNPAKAYEAPRVTKPVPFNLTMPKKKVVKAISENPSMAEGVHKWEKKTPDRFHSNRHGEPFRFTERVELRPTQAHTPQLMAVKRHRPVHALSREEQEKNEIEEMRKNQFKAHTVDEKVFKAPILPAKKEMKATKVEPFHLTESHKKENVPPQEPIEQEFHFHAKPAPKFETQAVKERKPIPPTIPHTPKFSEAGKASLHNWRRQRSRSNGSVSTSLRSGSSNGSLNSCGTERLKNTVIEPFSFEVRDKKLQEKKEKAIKKALDEERKQREFHANPCPNFSHPAMPERPTFSTTRPAPFQLSCETRGQMKKEKFLQQLEELRIEEKKASQFKAHPAKILNREPFKVKLEQTKNNLTQVAEFSLSTVKRAVERKTFEQFLKEREQEKEAARLQREQEKIKQEEEALAREREKATFHANPIRQYKTVEIKKAENDLLTVPKTPKFMKKPC